MRTLPGHVKDLLFINYFLESGICVTTKNAVSCSNVFWFVIESRDSHKSQDKGNMYLILSDGYLGLKK